ncbi:MULTISPECIES: hypothetical protein [Rhodomicrobium]|uniref:hypothetical protein n=1 Tax=Rhodomicrobium TaxID=1068 RepID=UPI000F7413D4|nr:MULTISPECIES: hypothetical protein [Rhodomicrobium]
MQLSDDFPMIMEREAGMEEHIPPVSVAFGLFPMLDGRRTQEAGHEVYRDVEHVKIAVPGDRNSLFFQPSNDVYRKRFPKAYAAYQERGRKPMEGMPIENWAPISRSVAFNLRAANIDTVEALAAVHEGHIDRIGSNGRELREKARAWLADAKSGAETVRLAAEKQDLIDQLAAMQAQINALAQQGVKLPEAGAASPEAARKPAKARA